MGFGDGGGAEARGLVARGVCRGLFVGRFDVHGYRRFALIGSAVVFMLLHSEVTHYAEFLLAGLVLGWLYQRTGSLWPPIALHVLNNAFSLTQALFLKQQ